MSFEVIFHDGNADDPEYRLNGKRVVIRDRAKANEVAFIEFSTSFNAWQIAKLIEHDLLQETDEPWAPPPQREWMPPPPVPDDALCFVHIDFTNGHVPWDLFNQLLILFDEESPRGFRFVTFDDTRIMAHLVHLAGAFKSVGDAKRNGWDKPIPPGFSTRLISKRNIEVTILNKYEGMYDHVCQYSICRCGTQRGGPPSWAPWTEPVAHARTICPFDPSSWKKDDEPPTP